MKPFALLVSLAVLLAPLAAAAFEFRATSLSSSIEGLHYDRAGAAVPLSVMERSLSRTHRLPGTAAPLELFRVRLEEGVPVRVPVATVPAPTGLTKAILLLEPAGRSGNIRARWLENSIEQSPPGTLRFHNFSRFSVAIELDGGKQPHLLPAGDTLLHPVSPETRVVRLRAAVEREGKWALFATVPQPARPNLRVLVIVRETGRNSEADGENPVELVTFYDPVPAPRPEVPPAD